MQTRSFEEYPVGHQKHNSQENTPDVAAILASPDYFTCQNYNCRMSRSACSMRKREARVADEEGRFITFSKCLDCEVKEGPVEKV